MAGIQIDGVNNKIDFDDDADTSISANTDDTLVIESGGVNVASITSGEFAINEGSGSIDFRVESDDDANMLLVDASGNSIGVGTNSPALANGRGIVVHGGSSVARVELRNDTSGAADSDGMFLTYSGTDAFVGNREAGTIQFWNNGSERARITSTGQLLLASSTDYASSKLQVNHPSGFGASTNIAHFRNEESSGTVFGITVQFRNQAPDNQTSILQSWQDSSAIRARCFADGDFQNHDNAYGSLSDERIKQDIRDSNSQWDDIKALKVRNFKKKDDVRQYGDEAWEQIGVIAQELEDVGMDKLVRHSDPTEADIASDPAFGTLYTSDDAETQDAVLYTADDEEVIAGNQNVGDIKTPSTKQIGEVKEISTKVKGVNYSVLYMKAIKALQEAMTRIETLETKVAALEGN